MNPITNPFSPGAGAPPPELVGRDGVLEQARILLGRVRLKRPEKSLLLTGLRGVGKTVLLNEIERMSRKDGYQSILLEAHEEKPLGELIFPALKSLLYELDRAAGAGDKVKRGLAVLRSFIGSVKLTVSDVALGLVKVKSIYNSLNARNFDLPQFESFANALTGFYQLKEKGLFEKDILTIVDFSLSSNVKRLWVIDLSTNTILFNTLVAHGKNTGEEFATNFSNQAESFKSSLGFYATAEVYNGKHGMSLKLDGLEKGVNDNARERAVVIHGADYVSESFIKGNKRLGRSQGCPAIPVEMNEKIISSIKNKSCLYIYHSSINHQSFSRLVS